MGPMLLTVLLGAYALGKVFDDGSEPIINGVARGESRCFGRAAKGTRSHWIYFEVSVQMAHILALDIF